MAEKINLLFDTIRRPDGKPYSNDEVAAALGPGMSKSYLWLLRKGERDNPTMKHLVALAEFFDVAPAYFFDEAKSAVIAGELAMLSNLAGTGITQVATRLGGLSPKGLQDIAAVIERFRASEGLDARNDGQQSHNKPGSA